MLLSSTKRKTNDAWIFTTANVWVLSVVNAHHLSLRAQVDWLAQSPVSFSVNGSKSGGESRESSLLTACCSQPCKQWSHTFQGLFCSPVMSPAANQQALLQWVVGAAGVLGIRTGTRWRHSGSHHHIITGLERRRESSSWEYLITVVIKSSDSPAFYVWCASQRKLHIE